MGIISTLLSGGVLIGKVCQGLSKSFGNAYVDKETGMRVSVAETSLCGVKFFQSSNTNDNEKSYAFNTNSNYDVSVVFPNDAAGNGIAYDVPATEKVDITPDLATNHTPDKEILVGPCASSDKQTAAANRVPMMKLSLNNMVVGGAPVCISDYKISCDTSGIKVNSGSRGLGALKYFNMTSDTGVIINNQSSIESSANGMDYSYDIDMEKLGLKNGDILDGQLHIEMNGTDMMTAFGTAKAEPLTEVEERALRALGVIE